MATGQYELRDLPPLPKDRGRKKRKRRNHKDCRVCNVQASVLTAYCQQNGITLEVKNDGHHWSMTKGTVLLEWWPNTGRLVRNKEWERAVKATSELQIACILDGLLKT